MELKKVGVKFFLEKDGNVPLKDLIPVFHRWIQQDKLEGLLVDVAEYTHVYQGPGLLLIAHEANYSVDETDGKKGFLYLQKRVSAKNPQEHLRTAFQRVLKAMELLEKEPEAAGKLKFAANHLQIFVNDRMDAPPGAQAHEELEKELRPFLDSLYGGAKYLIIPEKDPQKRTGFEVKVDKPSQISELLSKVS